MPVPPFELPRVMTSTAAISSLSSANGAIVASSRAVANGDGCFFYPHENVSKPLNFESGVTRPPAPTL